jgi:ferredoxin-NADP reductase
MNIWSRLQEPSSKKSKFLANQAVAVVHAGIGVTPMISMLNNIAAHVRDRC